MVLSIRYLTMGKSFVLTISFIVTFLSPTVYYVDALDCYHCGWSEISEGGEHVDCIEGNNLEDTSVNCEAEGWGSECISRVLSTGDGEDMKHWWFRSCVGSDMTCEEGYLDYGDNQLWTSCCSEDNCNDVDPTIEFPAKTTPKSGLSCYHCGWSEISQGGDSVDCIEGTNLEDNSVNCEEAGWGSECISRVLTTGEGEEMKHWWFRSCIGKNMTCEEGYLDTRDNQLHTSCCSEDNCNDGDPTIEFPAESTTETPNSSLSCYHCGWSEISQGGESVDCIEGTNLEDNIVNCEEEGWGSECLSRVLTTGEGDDMKHWWFRSCIGKDFTCEEGYLDYGDNQLWTSCCSEDNCNDGDPTIEFPAETTTEVASGLHCYTCGWENTSDGGDCVTGNNLEDTSVNCAAEGWGDGCITRVYRGYDGEEQYLRSCIGLYMTCVDGYGDYGDYGELWTSCCSEDNCNDDDPKDDDNTSTTPANDLQCFNCGWEYTSDGGSCVSGSGLEDTSINCAEEGWGSGCITRVFIDSDGEEQYFRSCIGKYMTCVEGYGNYGEYGELWTTCCETDNCNDDDPKDTLSSTTASTTISSTTERLTTDPTTMTSTQAVTTDPNTASGLQMALTLFIPIVITLFSYI